MDRKFGFYIVLGLVIGGVLGVFVGAASGNLIWIALGALGGVFVGWFATAANAEKRGGIKGK